MFQFKSNNNLLHSTIHSLVKLLYPSLLQVYANGRMVVLRYEVYSPLPSSCPYAPVPHPTPTQPDKTCHFDAGIARYIIFLARTTGLAPEDVCDKAVETLDGFTSYADLLSDIAPCIVAS